jgi:hypothetical protein
MTEKKISLSNMTLSQIQEKGLEHLLNKPKRYKPGPGRPKMSLDKRSQFSLTYWFRLIMKEYKKLRPSQRVRIALDCWKTLLNKSNAIPSDPEESRLNAEEVLGILKDVENYKTTPKTQDESALVPIRPNPTPTEQQKIEREDGLS